MTKTTISNHNLDDNFTVLEVTQTQIDLLARGIEMIREKQVHVIEASKDGTSVGDEVFILRELFKLQRMGVISSSRKVCVCK